MDKLSAIFFKRNYNDIDPIQLHALLLSEFQSWDRKFL